MLRIAIYGKGGIGKSTTVSNISAILASRGYRVMQIGCDPKADSTITLRGNVDITPLLDVYRDKLNTIELEDMYTEGFSGVICVEAGGPTPGLGCAGRGVAKALDLLTAKKYEEILKPDFVFYDVLGDVVCGGFSMPLRRNYADKVFVISSGEQMSIHAAMNLSLAVENFKRRGHNGLSGIIANKRNVPSEDEKLRVLSEDIECPIVGVINYSDTVQAATECNMTVLEYAPEDPVIEEYEKLAMALIAE